MLPQYPRAAIRLYRDRDGLVEPPVPTAIEARRDVPDLRVERAVSERVGGWEGGEGVGVEREGDEGGREGGEGGSVRRGEEEETFSVLRVSCQLGFFRREMAAHLGPCIPLVSCKNAYSLGLLPRVDPGTRIIHRRLDVSLNHADGERGGDLQRRRYGRKDVDGVDEVVDHEGEVGRGRGGGGEGVTSRERDTREVEEAADQLQLQLSRKRSKGKDERLTVGTVPCRMARLCLNLGGYPPYRISCVC